MINKEQALSIKNKTDQPWSRMINNYRYLLSRMIKNDQERSRMIKHDTKWSFMINDDQQWLEMINIDQ